MWNVGLTAVQPGEVGAFGTAHRNPRQLSLDVLLDGIAIGFEVAQELFEPWLTVAVGGHGGRGP